jgi:hypothetical protein
MSWLSTLGKDVGKVFGWLGSPKGQAIVGAGEAVAEAVCPALDGVLGITNTWLQEIYKAQALATAAGATGTAGGAQKAAMVLNALSPQVLAFAKTQGLPTPTATDLQTANNALVAFLNALGAGSSTVSTTAQNTTTAIPQITGTAPAEGTQPVVHAVLNTLI